MAAFDRTKGWEADAHAPAAVRELFSKRTLEAQDAARDFAARKGIDWDAITADQKVALLKTGAAETRQAKEDVKNDFAVWREQAAAASYRHRSLLRPDETRPHRRPRSAAKRPIGRRCRCWRGS